MMLHLVNSLAVKRVRVGGVQSSGVQQMNGPSWWGVCIELDRRCDGVV
jgi:hypothetical protein